MDNTLRFDRRTLLRAAPLALAGIPSGGSAAQESIRVGMVSDSGTKWGTHLDEYANALGKTAGIGELALADLSGKAAARLPKARVYRDTASMMQEFRPALVLVAVETHRAPAAIETALSGDAHVLAEKPACIRIEDFARMVNLAAGRRRDLMLAFATRLNPLAIKARELVQSGIFGKLYGARMTFLADQTRLTDAEYPRSWRAFRQQSGGGHLAWLGIHYIDLIQFLTGAGINRVTALTANIGGQPIEVEDSAAVVLGLSNGMLCTLQSGYYLDRGDETEVEIWGAAGWLRLDLKGGKALMWYTKGQQVRTHTAPNDPAAANEYPSLVQSAVNSSRGMGAPVVQAEECMRTLRAVFGAYRAAETGRTQTV